MNKTLTMAAMAAAAVLPYSASALSYNANTDGINAPAGATFTSSAGPGVTGLELKTIGTPPWTVMGVKGGTAGEIDVNEWLQVTLASPGHFESLTLGLLFNGPEYSDPQEIAVTTLDGGVNVYRLQVTTDTTATWTGPGGNASVTMLSKADDLPYAGVWKISNPFGDVDVTTLKLTAETPAGWTGSNKSDYGLQAFAVPDGGSTLALAGLGMVALGLLRRKLA